MHVSMFQIREHCFEMLEKNLYENFVAFYEKDFERISARDFEPRCCAIEVEHGLFQAHKIANIYKTSIMRTVSEIKKYTQENKLHSSLLPRSESVTSSTNGAELKQTSLSLCTKQESDIGTLPKNKNVLSSGFPSFVAASSLTCSDVKKEKALSHASDNCKSTLSCDVKHSSGLCSTGASGDASKPADRPALLCSTSSLDDRIKALEKSSELCGADLSERLKSLERTSSLGDRLTSVEKACADSATSPDFRVKCTDRMDEVSSTTQPKEPFCKASVPKLVYFWEKDAEGKEGTNSVAAISSVSPVLDVFLKTLPTSSTTNKRQREVIGISGFFLSFWRFLSLSVLLSLYLHLSLSYSISICLSLSLSYPLSLSVSYSISISLSVLLYLHLSLSVLLYLSLCTLYLSYSISLSVLYLHISLSLSVFISISLSLCKAGMKEGNVLFNDTLNTFHLQLYGIG